LARKLLLCLEGLKTHVIEIERELSRTVIESARTDVAAAAYFETFVESPSRVCFAACVAHAGRFPAENFKSKRESKAEAGGAR